MNRTAHGESVAAFDGAFNHDFLSHMLSFTWLCKDAGRAVEAKSPSSYSALQNCSYPQNLVYFPSLQS